MDKENRGDSVKKTKMLTFCALITAILCVICPLSVSFGTIPITFSLFAIMLCSRIFGSKIALISTLCYLILGLCGLPVFSNFTSGIGILFSLTGGFVFSYPIVALVSGVKTKRPFLMCLLSVAICYVFGVAYYMYIADITLLTALKTIVILFAPIDVLKAFLATVFGKEIRNRLIKTKLLDY